MGLPSTPEFTLAITAAETFTLFAQRAGGPAGRVEVQSAGAPAGIAGTTDPPRTAEPPARTGMAILASKVLASAAQRAGFTRIPEGAAVEEAAGPAVPAFAAGTTGSAAPKKLRMSKMQRKQAKRAAKLAAIIAGGIRHLRRRFLPGTVALHEIRRFQKTTALFIPKLAFQRLEKESMQESQPSFWLQSTALRAMKEASEAYLEGIFVDS